MASWINNDRFNELARGDNAILRKPPRGRHFSAACGIFGTPKQGKEKLRVICDARPANVLTEPRPEKLILFMLYMLVMTAAPLTTVTTTTSSRSRSNFSGCSW